jgi:nitrogen regulatory protein PII
MVRLVGNHFKLIFIIVKKDLSRRVLMACKRAGAEGGTVFPGRGTASKNDLSILGVTVEPQKEIILCLVPNNIVHKVLSKVRAAARLDKAGSGIAFVINSKNICGIAHLLSDSGAQSSTLNQSQKEIMENPEEISFQLIVTIVNKGMCGSVVDASKEAGADGGTIITGRGSGIHEKAKLFSFTIEPEKDIVLTLVPSYKAREVLDAIVLATELNEPGKGIAFVMDVEEITGINHPID